ncbi:MAG: hypothetical protein NT167_31845 [Verrucomicrobia bacterium]|nr:hypothetical protein [Verrucomicrobiota bacterium]
MTGTPLQTNTLADGTFTFTDPEPAGSTNLSYCARTVATASASTAASSASWRVIVPAFSARATPAVRGQSLDRIELLPIYGGWIKVENCLSGTILESHEPFQQPD